MHPAVPIRAVESVGLTHGDWDGKACPGDPNSDYSTHPKPVTR